MASGRYVDFRVEIEISETGRRKYALHCTAVERSAVQGIRSRVCACVYMCACSCTCVPCNVPSAGTVRTLEGEQLKLELLRSAHPLNREGEKGGE